MQGYALAIKGLQSDGIEQSRMVEDIDKGEYGLLPKVGSEIGEATHDTVQWAAGNMNDFARTLIQARIESEKAAKRRAQVEREKSRDAEREREARSRIFDITSQATLGGAPLSPDDIATQVGQDRRLQFLLMNSGKCYE